MTSRRDVIVGGSCALAACGADALAPRQRLSTLGKLHIADILPHQFGTWRTSPQAEQTAPEAEDGLAAKLYSQTVSRHYHDNTGAQIAMFAAYGPTQTDAMQLHRPEECYPAFGYTVALNAPVFVPLTPGTVLPVCQMTARTALRTEFVSYWARIGDSLPVSAWTQRRAILMKALEGVIADGILIRCSNLTPHAATAFALNNSFIHALVIAVAPQHRAALIGAPLAQDMR